MNIHRIFAVTTPQDMADARDVLTDPARHRCHPSVIQSHWQFLKEARGQRINWETIGPPAHRMSALEPMPPAHLRPPVPLPARPVISRFVAAIFPHNGGDAA